MVGQLFSGLEKNGTEFSAVIFYWRYPYLSQTRSFYIPKTHKIHTQER